MHSPGGTACTRRGRSGSGCGKGSVRPSHVRNRHPKISVPSHARVVPLSALRHSGVPGSSAMGVTAVGRSAATGVPVVDRPSVPRSDDGLRSTASAVSTLRPVAGCLATTKSTGSLTGLTTVAVVRPVTGKMMDALSGQLFVTDAVAGHFAHRIDKRHRRWPPQAGREPPCIDENWPTQL